jgi:methylthioribose-1-phosphate isomerase
MKLTVQALEWTGVSLKILDQRALPETIRYDDYQDAAGVAEAISTMRVRGAPAIGIAAAYAVALSIRQHCVADNPDWREQVAADITLLAHSRPTAVNLCWALHTMLRALASYQDLDDFTDLLASSEALAKQIHADDIAANYAMGEAGANLLNLAKGL